MTDFDFNLAKELNILFLVRIESLIQSRVQLSKKKHWHWKFSRNNFLTMSFVIYLENDVKNIELVKLANKNENICVMENPSNDFIMCNNSSSAKGCYLLHDRIQGESIRSGKVTDRPIHERLKEH